MDPHRKGYINNRPCEGIKSGTKHYSKQELVDLAKSLGISYSGLNKDPLCQKIREHYNAARMVQSTEALPIRARAQPRAKAQAQPRPREDVPKVRAQARPRPRPRPEPEPEPTKIIRVQVPESVGPFALKPVPILPKHTKDPGYWIAGPTYDHKEELKLLGSRWNPSQRMWWVPSDKILDVVTLLQKVEIQAPDVAQHSEKYQTLSEIMESLGISDIRQLVKLQSGQLQSLIDTIKVYEQAQTLKDMAVGLDEAGQIKLLLETLADKLCRCIKKVRAQQGTTESTAIAICINSIFKRRNLKIYKFRCDGEKGYFYPSKEGLVLQHK